MIDQSTYTQVFRRLAAAAAIAVCAAGSVQAQDIVIGQSVALSGPDADIGRDMRDGALAIFARANAANPAHHLQLVTLDTGGNDRRRADENAKSMLSSGAIAFFGFNSATNSVEAAALAEEERDAASLHPSPARPSCARTRTSTPSALPTRKKPPRSSRPSARSAPTRPSSCTTTTMSAAATTSPWRDPSSTWASRVRPASASSAAP